MTREGGVRRGRADDNGVRRGRGREKAGGRQSKIGNGSGEARVGRKRANDRREDGREDRRGGRRTGGHSKT